MFLFLSVCSQSCTSSWSKNKMNISKRLTKWRDIFQTTPQVSVSIGSSVVHAHCLQDTKAVRLALNAQLQRFSSRLFEANAIAHLLDTLFPLQYCHFLSKSDIWIHLPPMVRSVWSPKMPVSLIQFMPVSFSFDNHWAAVWNMGASGEYSKWDRCSACTRLVYFNQLVCWSAESVQRKIIEQMK